MHSQISSGNKPLSGGITLDDECGLEDFVKGVSHAGTKFDFKSLCASVADGVIVHLIFEWLQEKLEEYPSEFRTNPDFIKQLLRENKETLAEVIWSQYNNVHLATKKRIIRSLSQCKSCPMRKSSET